jgi:excisionase family DNA binding protein
MSPRERPLTAADIMTVREVAELLRVPVSTVGDWARRGIITSRKLGRRRVFIRARIEEVLLADGDQPAAEHVKSEAQVVAKSGSQSLRRVRW